MNGMRPARPSAKAGEGLEGRLFKSDNIVTALDKSGLVVWIFLVDCCGLPLLPNTCTALYAVYEPDFDK